MKLKEWSYSNLIVDYRVMDDLMTSDGHIILPKGCIVSKNLLQALLRRGNPPLFMIDHCTFTGLDSIKTQLTSDENLKKIVEKEIDIPEDDFLNLNEPPFENDISFDLIESRTTEYKKDVLLLHMSLISDLIQLYDNISDGKDLKPSSICTAITGKMFNLLKNDPNIFLATCNFSYKEEISLFVHCIKNTQIAIAIGAAAGYKESELLVISEGSLLAYIGLYLIDKKYADINIAHTENDSIAITSYPCVSAQIIDRYEDLNEFSCIIAYQAQEREDGSGFPKQKEKRVIHRFSKIVAIADYYNSMSVGIAMNSHPYTRIKQLIGESTDGTFNNDLVKSFLGYTSLFPVGSHIKLNSGECAVITAANSKFPALPIIMTLEALENKKYKNKNSTNILTSNNVSIVGIESEPLAPYNSMIGF